MTFTDLGLSPEVLKAVAEAGYVEPTPIQAKAIPYVLMGRDILGCAQTGTGKTASFTLPMIDVLASGRARARMPRSLILEPTRELAAQVAESFDVYGKYNKLSKALLIGGSSIADQEKILNRGVDVLIATPGRLLDLFERGKILLADVKILVIDESDRMLDMGFIPDVERIVGLLPKIRQTLFFSATMPPEIRRLADVFLMNPKEIAVSPPSSAAETVIQSLVKVAGETKDKRAALRGLLRSDEVKSALIFCNRKRDVDVLFRSLKKHGSSVAALHGDMAQPVRMETLQRFKNGEVELLVCSDVAARGLDLPAVSHVFNFDVPVHAEDYIHRIGRTGRAGRSGQAYTLALPVEARALAAVTHLLGHKIPEMAAGTDAAWSQAEVPERPGRRRRGRRKPEDRPRSKSTPKNVETAQPVTAQPVAAEPVAANFRPEKPAAVVVQIAGPEIIQPEIDEPEIVQARAPARPRKAAQRAAKAGATSTAKERPAKKPAGTAEPFGEHTPAFMLRPVNVA
ncbi:MAG: DEAD/DEAH box helicase [Alphaproteobacteria bacterium]